MESQSRFEFPGADPERLHQAVREVLACQSSEMPSNEVDQQALVGRLPSTAQLRAGAEASVKDEVEDAQAAEYFQSLVELGYLVASADGLAGEERETLALLIEYVTGAIVDRELLRLHFEDLDATCEALGRRERLVRVAANIEDVRRREEALSFAALVAIADGALAESELAFLRELGQHFSFSAEQVEQMVAGVAEGIRRELEG